MIIASIVCAIAAGLLFCVALCVVAGGADEQMERIIARKQGLELYEEFIDERRHRTMWHKLITWLWYRKERRQAADLAAGLAVGQILSGALAKQRPADGRRRPIVWLSIMVAVSLFLGFGAWVRAELTTFAHVLGKQYWRIQTSMECQAELNRSEMNEYLTQFKRRLERKVKEARNNDNSGTKYSRRVYERRSGAAGPGRNGQGN